MRVPVYLQIKENVAKQIEDGLLAPGQLIPSETELMRTWSVSRITARNVIKELSRDGLVYTVRGRGSFVAQPRVTNVLPTLNSYSHDVTTQGMRATNRVLSFSRGSADAEVAGNLLLQPGAPIIEFKRLHLANAKPVSVTHTALSVAALGPVHADLTLKRLENHSLYGLFETLDIVLVGGEQEVSAASAKASEARLLDVERGTALLYAERVVFTKERVRLEFTRIWTRPDRSRWKIELGPMVPGASRSDGESEIGRRGRPGNVDSVKNGATKGR